VYMSINMLIAIILFIIGLGVLIAGAEYLVRGSASLAHSWGISSLVIGLTIVAFGTSAPELVVNMFAAVQGSADIAIGNVIGSNIANILLIGGLAATITPLAVQRSTVWKEIPLALLGMILILVMGNDAFFDNIPFNGLGKSDGIALMGFFVLFMYYIVGLARAEHETPEEVKKYSNTKSILYILGGLVALFIGGKLLINNAIVIARFAGLSEAFIGLTIVAIGTSLPELATSIIATYRGQKDIAIGNIVGSNIFNVFWILGLTSSILSLPFNQSANIDVLVGIGATLLLFTFLFIGKRHILERWQGMLFILLYIAYVVYLVIRV
jgi:cation:H+ antiporter